MVPKGELIYVLPYLPKTSLDLRTRLRGAIEENLLYCKLKVIFRSKCNFNTLFSFKESLEKKIHSGLIHRCRRSNCKVTYYRKTFRHFLPERLNTWGSLIVPENTLKRLSTLQYLTSIAVKLHVKL